MAYTYIGLCNQVLRALNEVEFSGETDFNSAVGFHAHTKDFINYTLAHIYSEEDNRWPFQVTTGSVTLLTDGTVDYSLNATAAVIDWDSFYLDYDVALDSPEYKKLRRVPYDYYKNYHRVNDLNLTVSTSYGKPDFIARNYDNTVSVSPPANAAYTMKYYYWARLTKLSAHGDVPIIPETYEKVIVDGALARAYKFRDNIEQGSAADEDFMRGINTMRRNLIPQPVSMIVVD